MAIISASSPAAMNAPSSAIQEVAIVVATDRVRVLFADARGLQADALEIFHVIHPSHHPWGRL